MKPPRENPSPELKVAWTETIILDAWACYPDYPAERFMRGVNITIKYNEQNDELNFYVRHRVREDWQDDRAYWPDGVKDQLSTERYCEWWIRQTLLERDLMKRLDVGAPGLIAFKREREADARKEGRHRPTWRMK